MYAQLCPTLCDPMDCSPSGSSVHEIFLAKILEWVAIYCILSTLAFEFLLVALWSQVGILATCRSPFIGSLWLCPWHTPLPAPPPQCSETCCGPISQIWVPWPWTLGRLGKQVRGTCSSVWTGYCSSAGHSTGLPPQKLGFCWRGREESGYWGHSGYVGHRSVFSISLSLLYATPPPQIEVTWTPESTWTRHHFAWFTSVASLALREKQDTKTSWTHRHGTLQYKVQRELTLPTSTVWSCTAGVPNLWTTGQYLLQIWRSVSGSIRLEIKCTINVMCLNHPETLSPPSVHGKIAFHEICPWCRKGWGLLLDCASPCSLAPAHHPFLRPSYVVLFLPATGPFTCSLLPWEFLSSPPPSLTSWRSQGGCLWPLPQLVHMLSSLKEFQAAPS